MHSGRHSCLLRPNAPDSGSLQRLQHCYPCIAYLACPCSLEHLPLYGVGVSVGGGFLLKLPIYIHVSRPSCCLPSVAALCCL